MYYIIIIWYLYIVMTHLCTSQKKGFNNYFSFQTKFMITGVRYCWE